MKYYTTAKQFYKGKEWNKLRQILIDEQLAKYGEVKCAKCGRVIDNPWEIIGHHKQHLTLENLNNAEISLNQDNVELICFHPCHNSEHNRWGFDNLRRVIVVHGSPLSGKTSYVKEHAGKDDIIIDIDSLWQTLSNNPRYVKPNTLKGFVFAIYNACIENVTMRTGQWNNAWIIGSLPRVMERNRLIDKLGAESIHVDTDKETCISRLNEDKDRELIREEYLKFIEDYWNNYQPDELISDRED